ncbi:MAG TPA: hypothetical protein VHT53_08160 [Candidatus Elarobacter sp.]|nr:hypothetical protein [Candidatus Elarobacter sp.]
MERLLGAGLFYFTDSSSGSGRQGHIRWDCGCTARESAPDRFHVSACDAHAENVSASR